MMNLINYDNFRFSRVLESIEHSPIQVLPALSLNSPFPLILHVQKAGRRRSDRGTLPSLHIALIAMAIMIGLSH